MRARDARILATCAILWLVLVLSLAHCPAELPPWEEVCGVSMQRLGLRGEVVERMCE